MGFLTKIQWTDATWIDRHGGNLDNLPKKYDFLKVRKFPHF